MNSSHRSWVHLSDKMDAMGQQNQQLAKILENFNRMKATCLQLSEENLQLKGAVAQLEAEYFDHCGHGGIH